MKKKKGILEKKTLSAFIVRSGLFEKFLLRRKFLKINLAVLHYLNKRKAWIGEQLPAGVVRFFTGKIKSHQIK